MIHRVGGLEVNNADFFATHAVIHRVGGLEGIGVIGARQIVVIHRVGGLEVWHQQNAR